MRLHVYLEKFSTDRCGALKFSAFIYTYTHRGHQEGRWKSRNTFHTFYIKNY